MSKYTTEVRFLCESLTDHTESQGFTEVDNILTEASPIIFSFQFPIFDEAYRLPLERKILRHYYTREISEETYGLWKLRLQDRMETIMPYYNKLYESALLSFNPFYDVDLTTNHAGNQSGVVDTSEKENRSRENEIERKANEIIDEVGNRVENKTGNRQGSNEKTSEGNEIVNGVKNTVNNGVENNSLSTTNDHTGTIKDDNIGEHVKVNNDVNVEHNSLETTNDHTGTIKDDNIGEHVTVNNDVNTESVNGTRNADKNSNYESVNTANGNNTNTTNSTGTSNNTQWDLFSDTPQGGIDGMEIPNGSAPTGLNNHMYLTTARKVMDNGGTTNTSNSGEITSNVGTDTGSGKEVNAESSRQNTDYIGNRVENGNTSESNVKTYNEKNEIKNGGTKDNIANRVENANTSESNLKTYNEKNEIKNGGSKDNINNGIEVNDTSRGNTNKEQGTDTENNSEIFNETNVNSSGRNNNENITDNEGSESNRIGSKVSTTTDEYLQRVSGKSGGMSYSAMLIEYRETFINIDEMIIEELSDLFFGLW